MMNNIPVIEDKNNSYFVQSKTLGDLEDFKS